MEKVEKFVRCNFSRWHEIGNAGTVKRIDPGTVARYGTAIVKGVVTAKYGKVYEIAGFRHYAHILVADHFIPNPNDLPCVKHRDGDKLNNWWLNLNRCTHAEAIAHTLNVSGRKPLSGIDHGAFLMCHTDEARQRMSVKKLGWMHPRFTGYYFYAGERYDSANMLSVLTGINPKTIKRYALAGINGYAFEPVERVTVERIRRVKRVKIVVKSTYNPHAGRSKR